MTNSLTDSKIEAQILALAKERLSMMKYHAKSDEIEQVFMMYQGLSTLVELAMPSDSALSEGTRRALQACESEGSRLCGTFISKKDTL